MLQQSLITLTYYFSEYYYWNKNCWVWILKISGYSSWHSLFHKMDPQCSLCADTVQYSFKIILKDDHAIPVILSSTVNLGWGCKKTQETQAKCDCFISAAHHCKDVISQLAGEGKAKECLCQPDYSQGELQIHLEIFLCWLMVFVC